MERLSRKMRGMGGKLTKSEVRSKPTPNPSEEGKSSEVVFVTRIRATLQKHFALKGVALDAIIW